MRKYLEPTDPNAFLDFPLQESPPTWAPDYVPCPKCFQHGGWNLEINAYPLRNMENTPENRHKYSHFRAHCGQCNGYGWTSQENAKCLHEMVHHRNTGRCLNEYKCIKCGKIEEIDSSD